MAGQDLELAEQKTRKSALSFAQSWGESSIPPLALATLVAAQHLQPPQVLPLLFPPALLFSSYLNVNGYVKDAAGTSAAWSGLYLLLARRRKLPLSQRWSPRGVIRGGSMGLAAANLLCGGFVYAVSTRDEDNT